MASSPHLVLDGAVLAAEITAPEGGDRRAPRRPRDPGARPWPNASAPRLDRVRLEVRAAADGFVAGEASAVVQWIQRESPRPPRRRRGSPSAACAAAPTLVQNVETLAHLALIARYGASWFRDVGTPAEPGSMLVTVLGAVREPGVREVAIGTPVGKRARLAGDRPCRCRRCCSVATSAPGWRGRRDGPPFSSAGLAAWARARCRPDRGAAADACGLAETARVVRYLAGRVGRPVRPVRVRPRPPSPARSSGLRKGEAPTPTLVRRWLGQVDGRGGCPRPTAVCG